MFKKRAPSPAQKKAFGQIIRGERKRRGLTQEDLAELVGCSVRWLIRIEAGKSSPNNMDTIRLLSIFGLDPADVAEEVGIHVPVLTD